MNVMPYPPMSCRSTEAITNGATKWLSRWRRAAMSRPAARCCASCSVIRTRRSGSTRKPYYPTSSHTEPVQHVADLLDREHTFFDQPVDHRDHHIAYSLRGGAGHLDPGFRQFPIPLVHFPLPRSCVRRPVRRPGPADIPRGDAPGIAGVSRSKPARRTEQEFRLPAGRRPGARRVPAPPSSHSGARP